MREEGSNGMSDANSSDFRVTRCVCVYGIELVECKAECWLQLETLESASLFYWHWSRQLSWPGGRRLASCISVYRERGERQIDRESESERERQSGRENEGEIEQTVELNRGLAT